MLNGFEKEEYISIVRTAYKHIIFSEHCHPMSMLHNQCQFCQPEGFYFKIPFS